MDLDQVPFRVMSTPTWFTEEEMGGWDPDPESPRKERRDRRALAVVAFTLLAVVLGGVGWLIYTSVREASPTDIRNVISRADAETLARHTLGGPRVQNRYRLERIGLTKNHLFWVTSWRRIEPDARRCVAVGEEVHMPEPVPLGYGPGLIQGPQTPVAEIVTCRRWLPLLDRA